MRNHGHDVVVIGGGIIGCSAAALLAERGVPVLLLEETAIGAGASGRNLGVIQHPFDPVLGGLYHDSLDRYRALGADAEDFAIDPAPAGLLLVSPDPQSAQARARQLAGVVPELSPAFLDPDALAAAEPSLAMGLAACRLETGYPVPPASATAAWAALARRRGAEIRIGVAARPVVENGRVTSVVLSDGSRIAADVVLVAAGPWTPNLVGSGWEPIQRTWGVTVQVRLGEASPRQVVEEDAVDAINRPAVAAQAAAAAGSSEPPPSLFSIASAHGISTLGSTFLPDEPDPGPVAQLLRERGARFLPVLAGAEVVGVRRCARPQSLDGRPFIGPFPGVSGLHVAAGHGPWGISTGPASAALAVAAMLDGAPVPAELQAGRLPG
jgi:glycine/D-amino acid oxidase-like deaminating enzyme